LLGNKCDLLAKKDPEKHEKMKAKIQSNIDAYDIAYFEMSALTGENVDTFKNVNEALFRIVYSKRQEYLATFAFVRM